MNDFRAGAASLPLGPPLGLPMVGFVRQPSNARGYGLPLEVGALALECGDTRVLLCGVDVVGIIHPQIEPPLYPPVVRSRRLTARSTSACPQTTRADSRRSIASSQTETILSWITRENEAIDSATSSSTSPYTAPFATPPGGAR